MKNFVAIDPSEDSTAMSIKSNKGYYLFNYTSNSPTYKWNKLTQDIINFRFYTYNSSENYSEKEIFTLQTFIKISNDLLGDILSHIDPKEETIVGIEGYNFNPYAGNSIIDLVGVSTMIRSKILEHVPSLKLMNIIAPKSIKSQICELIYGLPTPKLGKKGKPLKQKLVAVSPYGVKGGDFTKTDMFRCILDGKVDSPLYEWCINNQTEILSYKDIKKPMEDIDDSILILKLMETKY